MKVGILIGCVVIGCVILAALVFLPSREEGVPPVLIVLPGEFYAHSACTLIVEDPAVAIARAGPDAYSWDSLPVLVPRLPLKENYAAGDEPPVMAAVELENGRLVAYGGGATYDDGYSALESTYRNMELGLDVLDWLDPENGKKVLFYWKSGSYFNPTTISTWIETIKSAEYQVDNENREGTPITSGVLAGSDVLLMINPEGIFDNAEITAIKNWVYAGGGFFFSLQADQGMQGKPYYSNPILEGLGAGIEFQDDQLRDNVEAVRGDDWRPRIYPISDPVWNDNLTDNFYAHSACTLVVSSPARTIVKAGPNAYSEDTEKVGGRQELKIFYAAGDRPPMMAAVELENGRLVAYVGGGTYAEDYTVAETRYRNMELGVQVIDWLDWENGKKVLFYSRDDYYKADTECEIWVTYLKDIGYTVDNTRDPITPELLAPYNVLTFVDTEAGFENSEIEAIKDWVYAGGGFYLCGLSDYDGYGKVHYYNPILEALGSGIEFQDDELVDYVQNIDSKGYKPRIFLENSEVWYRPYWMSIPLPDPQSGEPGETLTYEVTIKNEGLVEDNYSIVVSDTKNWSLTLSENLLTVPADEDGTVTVIVAIPAEAPIAAVDSISIRATGIRYSFSRTFYPRVLVPLPTVSVSPSTNSGSPGETLTYSITVKNEELREDNFSIVVDDVEGWPLSLSENLLTIPAGESEAVTLTVVIPADAAAGTQDYLSTLVISARGSQRYKSFIASVTS